MCEISAGQLQWGFIQTFRDLPIDERRVGEFFTVVENLPVPVRRRTMNGESDAPLLDAGDVPDDGIDAGLHRRRG
jgi:hypothetical protein